MPKIDQCYMIVDGIKVGWKNGKCLVFDDSFPHSVTYEKESNGDRAVLCVDLWHPQLTKFHRRAFRSVFGSCEQ